MKLLLFLAFTLWSTLTYAEGLKFREGENPLRDVSSPHSLSTTDRLSNDVIYGRCSRFAKYLHSKNMVHITGSIEPNDGMAFEEFFAQIEEPSRGVFENCGSTVVSLDVTGGSVAAAIRIGELISERNLPTVVLEGDVCRSACLYMFAAGQPFAVFPGSTLEVHFPRNVNADSLDKALGYQVQRQPAQAIEDLRKDIQNVINQSHRFFVAAQQNPYLFDLLSRSPVRADEFWQIDSYFELQLIGATTLTSAGSGPDPIRELDEKLATSACAVEVLSFASVQTVGTVSFSRYGDDAFVGIGNQFCFLTLAPGVNDNDTHICVFDAGTLNTTLAQIETTPLAPWVNTTGGWWPNGTFSHPNMMHTVLAEAGIRKEQIALFFREAMTGTIDGVELTGLFCSKTNSISSVEMLAFGNASEFNSSCPNGLGFCRMRSN